MPNKKTISTWVLKIKNKYVDFCKESTLLTYEQYNKARYKNLYNVYVLKMPRIQQWLV